MKHNVNNPVLVDASRELIERLDNETSYFASCAQVLGPRRIFPDGERHTEKMNIREFPDDEDP